MKFNPQKQVLDNGLTVVTVPMATESLTILLAVRVGSRDETKKNNGVSHFLEHMVFKGTKKWPDPQQMNQVIDSVGGVFNAFTDHEYTGFWVKLAKKHLDLGLEYIYQAVFEPLLPKDEMERERGVILEEIKMYEDSPMAKVGNSFVSQVYSLTSLGRQIIGTAENIRNLKRQDFYDHLNGWYQPSNMVLGLAGNIGNLAIDSVKQLFKSQSKNKVQFTDLPKRLDFFQEKAKIQMIAKDIQQAHFCLGVRTFARKHQDRYALAVLNTILGGNSSSRLFNEIREKRGLVYYVSSRTNSFFETGYLVTQAGCSIEKIDEAVKVTLGEYQKMTDGKQMITEKELSLAKEFLKGRLALGLESSYNVADKFTVQLLLEGKMEKIEEIIKGIEIVKIADIKRVAKNIFNKKDLNLTIVGPFKDKHQFDNIV